MVENDKHYTKKWIADKLINYVKLPNYDVIVEPSAGDGAILNRIEHNNIISFDINPECPKTIKQDFLTVNKNQFKDGGIVATIGNPPFGYRSQLAIEFFNKASEFSNTIAFIVSRSFRKSYIINQLNPHFIKDVDVDIPVGSFESNTKVRCCIQVWKKIPEVRYKILLPHTTNDFYCIPQGDNFDISQCEYAIRRTGYGTNVGEIINTKDASPITQFIFINTKNKLAFKRIQDIQTKLYDFSYNSTGISPTFTIGELCKIYNKQYRKTLF